MAIQQKQNIPTPETIKSSPHTFDEKELNQLKELRSKMNQITIQFGQLSINKIKLEESQDKLKNELASLEQQEINLAKSLSNKYGKGTINLETGTFTPIK